MQCSRHRGISNPRKNGAGKIKRTANTLSASNSRGFVKSQGVALAGFSKRRLKQSPGGTDKSGESDVPFRSPDLGMTT